MAPASPASAPATLTCPTFPADNTARYLLDTDTCAVWDTTTGEQVRREWARTRGLPRLVFAADSRPQLGEAVKRGLVRAGVTVDKGAPRWPSIHGKSGIEHGAVAFKLADLKAVPRGRPAAEPPPTYGAFLAEINPAGFKLPRFVEIDAIAEELAPLLKAYSGEAGGSVLRISCRAQRG